MNRLLSMSLVVAVCWLASGCTPSIMSDHLSKPIAIAPGVDLSQFKPQAINSAQGSVDAAAGGVNSTTF